MIVVALAVIAKINNTFFISERKEKFAVPKQNLFNEKGTTLDRF